MKRKKQNLHLDHTISKLKKVSRDNKISLWMTVSRYLEKTKSGKVAVNIGKINKLTKSGNVTVVPGKVLGSGNIDHKLIVGGYSFSESAKAKIINAGGKAISLEEASNSYPDGKKVKLIGG